MDTLWNQKRALTKLLKDDEKSGTLQNFDRVEISRKLFIVDAQYEATKKVMEGIQAKETALHNSEMAKQQSEALHFAVLIRYTSTLRPPA